MGLLLICFISAVAAVMATVFFFFGTKHFGTPWAFFFILNIGLLLMVNHKLDFMSTEQLFFGFNWLRNPDFWHFMTTPVK